MCSTLPHRILTRPPLELRTQPQRENVTHVGGRTYVCSLHFRRPAAALVLLGAILTLGAASAGASGTLVAYNMYPLVSDGAAVTAPLADTSLVKCGASVPPRPHHGGRRTTRPTTLRSTQASARRCPPSSRSPGTDRNGREPEHHRLRRSAWRCQRSLALPVRHAGRSDPRMDADAECDERRGRCRQLGGIALTPGSRPRTTACTRPTSITHGSTSSTRRSSRLGLPFKDPKYPRAGAVRHPGPRHEHLRHLCPPDEEERGPGRRQRLRRRVHDRRDVRRNWHRARRQPNAECAVGDSRWHRRTSAPTAATCSSGCSNGRISAYQLRSTDSKWVYKGQERRSDRDRRSLAVASATAPRRDRRTTCTSLRPNGGTHGLFGFIASVTGVQGGAQAGPAPLSTTAMPG